jgi:mevalonate kinase
LIYKGKGNAKLLITGEHIIFYGYPALGIPLPQTLEITLDEMESFQDEKRENFPLLIRSGQMPVEWKKRLFSLFDHYCRQLDLNFSSPLTLTVESGIPPGSGLGSSAALSAALLQALLDYAEKNGQRNTPVSLSGRQSLAREGESVFHGRSSGIDTSLALSETPLVFRPEISTDSDPAVSLNPTPARFPDCYLIVGSIPREKNTRDLIQEIRLNYQNNRFSTRNLVEKLGGLSCQIIDRISGAEVHPDKTILSETGRLLKESHQCLIQLGLSHPLIDRLLIQGVESGASGGKISGAGGGGAFYLITPGLDEALMVLRMIREELAGCYSPQQYFLNLYQLEQGRLLSGKE